MAEGCEGGDRMGEWVIIILIQHKGDTALQKKEILCLSTIQTRITALLNE